MASYPHEALLSLSLQGEGTSACLAIDDSQGRAGKDVQAHLLALSANDEPFLK